MVTVRCETGTSDNAPGRILVVVITEPIAFIEASVLIVYPITLASVLIAMVCSVALSGGGWSGGM